MNKLFRIIHIVLCPLELKDGIKLAFRIIIWHNGPVPGDTLIQRDYLQ